MARKKTDTGSAKELCPMGKVFQSLNDLARNAPEFMEHLNQSRLELLKAVKTLVDSKIEALEKGKTPGKKKVARKITIE